MVYGFTIGFSYFVFLHAFRLTMRIKRPTSFIVLIWLEIIGSLILYGLVAVLFVNGVIPHSFWVYFIIIVGWVFQLQCLVQIIVNRICILIDKPSHRTWLKIGMLAWIGAINIIVGVIWIPTQLQVNEKYHNINLIFDRLEKSLYLVTDAALNRYFIHIVRKRLVSTGLKKYDKLVRYNLLIIWVSLGMDVMIIAMMSLKNAFLYTVFHPLAFMVKLEIEMTMSNLIVAVARGTGVYIDEFGTESTGPSNVRTHGISRIESQAVRVTVHTEAVTDQDDLPTSEFSQNLDVKASAGDVMQMSQIRLKTKKQTESLEDSNAS
ncbi:hypothetical protein K435DRAFT_965339 [Dendrothele bispora CBS 962.96]|uniref:Uncharacterized protein n=1 Tax=Dendrothele bispora (strain CBS 962.96) TaxID=1314807 RepID=A0A4S8M7A5_DENBC|nr:hypothetical protein K435DRAFT_965339 [Dendrothele bispora CBS 962.96]